MQQFSSLPARTRYAVVGATAFVTTLLASTVLRALNRWTLLVAAAVAAAAVAIDWGSEEA